MYTAKQLYFILKVYTIEYTFSVDGTLFAVYDKGSHHLGVVFTTNEFVPSKGGQRLSKDYPSLCVLIARGWSS